MLTGLGVCSQKQKIVLPQPRYKKKSHKYVQINGQVYSSESNRHREKKEWTKVPKRDSSERNKLVVTKIVISIENNSTNVFFKKGVTHFHPPPPTTTTTRCGECVHDMTACAQQKRTDVCGGHRCRKGDYYRKSCMSFISAAGLPQSSKYFTTRLLPLDVILCSILLSAQPPPCP